MAFEKPTKKKRRGALFAKVPPGRRRERETGRGGLDLFQQEKGLEPGRPRPESIVAWWSKNCTESGQYRKGRGMKK